MNSRGTECGETAGGRLPYLPKPGEPVDALGRPLPPHLYAVFAEDGAALSGQVVALEAIVSELKRRRGCRGLGRLNVTEVLRALGRVRRPLTRGRPKCVCPSCSGSGELKRYVACRTCIGLGWISEGDYEALNPTLRGIAEGFRNADAA